MKSIVKYSSSYSTTLLIHLGVIRRRNSFSILVSTQNKDVISCCHVFFISIEEYLLTISRRNKSTRFSSVSSIRFFIRMDGNSGSTLLEQLSVEIILKVFASLSLSEIHGAFSGLNSYLNFCIQALATANHIVAYNDTSAANILHSFPTQIGRLIFTYSPTVDFTSLIHLRSLTLKYGTPAQFDGIRPEHFPWLEILHLCGSK